MPAVCPNVQVIAPFECIGDSLVKINENFYNLKTVVCDINPDVLIADSSTIKLSFLSDTRILSGDVIVDSINSVHIANNAVTNAKLADDSVTSDKIQNLSITTNKIAAQAVTTDRIFPNSVTVNEIANNAVTTAKIQDSAVLYGKMQNVSVANRVLGSTVAGGSIQEVQIQTAMIANNAVTTDKILDSAVTAGKLGLNAVITDKINNSAVTTDKIANDAVIENKIATNAVTTNKINNAAVTTTKINDSAVTESKLATDAVTTSKIVDRTITGAKIAEGTITGINVLVNSIPSDRIQNKTVTSGQLADSSVATSIIASKAVTTDKIADNAVTVGQIADNAVTTNKIINNAVTDIKIASNAVITSKIADSNITTAKIANDAVTTEKIPNNAITTPKILDSAVTTNKIINDAVTEAKILNNAVTTNKILNSAVTTDKVNNLSITTEKINNSAVTTDKILNNAVTTDKVNNLSITTGKIADLAITTGKINNSAVTTDKINDSAVTTNKINKSVSGNRYDKVVAIDSLGNLNAGRTVLFYPANNTVTATYFIENQIPDRLFFSGNIDVQSDIVGHNIIANNEGRATHFVNTHQPSTRNADTVFYTSANNQDHYIRRNTKQGTVESLGINDMLGEIIPSLANIRLSPSNTFPVITTDHVDVSSIFLHPYNGNIVSLYDIATGRWIPRQVPGVLPFPLTGLAANTNYDIFLWLDGNSTFRLDFTAWTGPARGNNLGSPKTMLNGVKVKTGALNRRFIGCLRTTATERTTVSFGREWIVGGSHPKFFIWNNQNRVSAAFSILEGSNWASAGPGNGARNGNGPFSNFGFRNNTIQGTNNRISFITGESSEVEIQQHHGIGSGGVYAGHIMDLEQSDNVYTHQFHRQGQHLTEYTGGVDSNFSAGAGYHYIQLMLVTSGTFVFSLFEPGPGGDAKYPGGRHSWGTTGRISDY